MHVTLHTVRRHAVAISTAVAAATWVVAPTPAGAEEWAGSAACQWVNAHPTISGTSIPSPGLGSGDFADPSPETLSISIPDELLPTMLAGETYTARGDARSYSVAHVYDDAGGFYAGGFSTVDLGTSDPPNSAASNTFGLDTIRNHVATHFNAYVNTGTFVIVGGELVYVPPESFGPVTLDISCTPGPAPLAELVISPFGQPVDNDGLNLAQAGRTVPFKFSATRGGQPVLGLTDADVAAVVRPFDCDTTQDSGDPVDAYATGGSGLQDNGDGSYQLNVKTAKSWRGCYRIGLTVDGVARTADFRF